MTWVQCGDPIGIETDAIVSCCYTGSHQEIGPNKENYFVAIDIMNIEKQLDVRVAFKNADARWMAQNSVPVGLEKEREWMALQAILLIKEKESSNVGTG